MGRNNLECEYILGEIIRSLSTKWSLRVVIDRSVKAVEIERI